MSAKRMPLDQAQAGAGVWSAWEDEERRYAKRHERHERLRRTRARQREKLRAWLWWPDDGAQSADAIDDPWRGERGWAGS